MKTDNSEMLDEILKVPSATVSFEFKIYGNPVQFFEKVFYDNPKSVSDKVTHSFSFYFFFFGWMNKLGIVQSKGQLGRQQQHWRNIHLGIF
jgi:hypothetical protein